MTQQQPAPAGAIKPAAASTPAPPAIKKSHAVLAAGRPYGHWRALWTTTVFLIVVYDTFSIPFRWAWSVPSTWEHFLTDAFLDVLLWIDLFFHFREPFEKGGLLVFDRKSTIRHYLRGWFAWDFLASIPFDVFQAVSGANPLWRINRVVRLMHVGDYAELVERYTSMNPSVIHIVKFVIFLVVIAHYGACGWFYVIVSEGPSVQQGWTKIPSFLYQPAYFQYIASLYWTSITMMGFGAPVPRTDLETNYELGVTVVGAFFLVAIVGKVGSLVANMDSAEAAFRERMDAINDYMRYRRLPLDLQNRVRSYYAYLWKSRKGMDEAQVLEDLPEYLRKEVAMFLNRDIIAKVPLFQGADPQFISTIVMMMRPRISLPQAYIVKKGEVGKEMFFISRGEVEIVSEDGKVVYARLKEGSFFGEIALITSGKRTASVRASTFCDLFVLTKEDFDEVLADFPDVAHVIQEAANARYNLLKKAAESKPAAAAPVPAAPPKNAS
jgi:hypothetical protein